MVEAITSRQLQIIEASGKILLEKGVKALTTKALAKEMNFSESALYRHFKSKEDIIVLMLDYLSNNFQERLTPIIHRKDKASKVLIDIFNSQLSFFNTHKQFAIAILSEGLIAESEKINAYIMRMFEFKSNLLSLLIDKGKANGEFKKNIKTPDMVHILMASFRLMMLKWKFSNFELDLTEKGNHIINETIQLFKK